MTINQLSCHGNVVKYLLNILEHSLKNTSIIIWKFGPKQSGPKGGLLGLWNSGIHGSENNGGK